MHGENWGSFFVTEKSLDRCDDVTCRVSEALKKSLKVGFALYLEYVLKGQVEAN